MILDFIKANPDAILGIVSAALGWLGWRKKRESTAAEVDKWASTAAGVITLAIRSGLFKDHEQAIDDFLRIFHQLATVAGVKITPAHEKRALAIATRAVTATGQVVLLSEAKNLAAVANAALERMSARGVQP